MASSTKATIRTAPADTDPCTGLVEQQKPTTLAFARSFLFAETSPVNLAIVRIVVFAVLFIYADVGRLVWCSELDPGLRSIAPGVNWLARWLPINSDAVSCAAIVCRISCVAAILGWRTRFFACLALLTALYALMVPQCFGKVDHLSDHLIWFVAILACSPCADALSIDKALANRRAAFSDRSAAKSWRYGLPIRTMWLLFGIIYFFPGLWKVWRCGLDWALSDNFRLMICERWLVAEPGLSPFIHLEKLPALCQFGAILSVIFELSFVFLILFVRTRRYAVAAGFVFHSLTHACMGIVFWALQACYVVFVDWAAILARFTQPAGVEQRPQISEPIRLGLISAVCAALIAINASFGMMQKERCWPFACYPTFAWTMKKESALLRIEAADENGKSIPVALDQVMKPLYPHLRYSFITPLVSAADPSVQQEGLRALWRTLQKQVPTLARASDVKFYRETYLTASGDPSPLVKRELLYDFSCKHR